jgi:hypothetical protein
VSELVRPRPHAAVIAWIEQRDEDELSLSVVTIGELRKGIAKQKARQRREELEQWLQASLLQRFRGRVISVDLEIASEWGSICGRAEAQGRPVPVVDALIGATAICRGLSLVTRNVADFSSMTVQLVNPWDGTQPQASS